MKKPTPQYTILGVLLLWALIAQGTFSGLAIYGEAISHSIGRLPFGLESYSTTVRYLTPSYQNSALKVGDTILAIDGNPIVGQKQIDDERMNLHPGKRLVFTVSRVENGRAAILTAPIVIENPREYALAWAYVIGVSVLLPFVCLIVGFYIAFARPLDPLAWITMAMLTSFGQLPAGGTSWAVWSPFRELLLIYHPVLSNTWPLWMVLFSLYFPVPFALLRRNRWIIVLLAAVPAVLTVLDLYGNFVEGTNIWRLGWMASFDRASRSAVTVLFFLYVWGFFTCLAVKKRMLTSSDARRRLNVMLAGCSLSLVPSIEIVFNQLGWLPMLPPWIAVICLLMLVFFPLTMAYVIVVQRAMDVRMVLRSGVQYAFASTGIRVLRIVLIVAVVALTVYLEQQSNHRIEGIAIAAAGIAAISLVARLAGRLRSWMDRRFFREAYNAELILTDLTNSVAGIRDTRRLLETVVTRIAASLHVPRIAFFLEQGGRFQPAYALGFQGGPPAVHFSQDAATVRTLKRLKSASRVYFDDPQSWVHGTSEHEQAALHTLETQVLLPVNLDNKMMGMISLGSKRSEVPYTKADLQLLSAVASQTGLAIENAQLTESIRREIASRERLDRELEIAREVQQRLFPQTLPLVKGLDFAGYCRPAQGVGGDYYDFIHLPDGRLGIAVGDVSGKGIAAALMMASLQASLRGQTIRPCPSLAEMIQHINRLVFDASADNRYATFFYAEYDPLTRRLRYVNAGHNPPFVYRKHGDGQEFLRLDEGGTVVGLFPDFPFHEASIDLKAGDIVVAFTDGISEAMNVIEEEFDEERLMSALRRCPPCSAADIIGRILREVDGFTGEAKQHDDMTIVVLRLEVS